MKSKISQTALMTVLLIAYPFTMTAQDKQFTLEDLNFGGTNYRKMQPQNQWFGWWGEKLVNTDVEECYLIDTKPARRVCSLRLTKSTNGQRATIV